MSTTSFAHEGTFVPNVLSIAGTDPTGGAGIQADLKSFSVHGGYGMCVVTALVAQNTQGVREIHVPPTGFLRAQLDAVSDDVTIHAVKTGMLGNAEIISTVARWWDDTFSDQRPTLVVDPVMIATSGDRLLEAEAEQALIDFLFRADVITPNVPELALLAGENPAESAEELLTQAERVADAHEALVLAKGGHLHGTTVIDTLVFPSDRHSGKRPAPHRAVGERVDTHNTHGTGCSVSAALAALAARGMDWPEAVDAVKTWMTAALRHADQLTVGHGHGPIHHFAPMD